MEYIIILSGHIIASFKSMAQMGDSFLQAMIIAKAKKGVYLKAPIAAGGAQPCPGFRAAAGFLSGT